MCKIREMNLETAKYYGYEAQSNQLVEECAELIQAVNKYRRVETGLGQPVAEDKKAIARDNSGNTTVASPVNTATVITIN